MTVQTFFKGLAMLLISVVVTAFSQGDFNMGLLLATAIAAVLGYVGVNLTKLLDSTTEPGNFNWWDALGALLVAIGTAITESVALIVVEGKLLLPVLLKVVVSTTLTYIAGTLFSGPKAKSRKLFTLKSAA